MNNPYLSVIGLTGLGLCLFGVGCQTQLYRPPVSNISAPIMAERAFEVTRTLVAPGLEMVQATVSTSTQGRLILFGFDQHVYRFSFASTGTRVRMQDWKEGYPNAVAAINGVYFMEDLTPAGLFAGEGTRQIKRVFDKDKSALMMVGESFQIFDTTTSTISLNDVKEGAQTYPILVKDGKEVLTRDTGKEARRSWIGTDQNGTVWLGILPDGEVSLFELMKRVMGLGIEWDMVVNLDGGPSTGVFVKGDEGMILKENLGGVPNVILVEKR